jgi:hypothetical protein
MDVAGKRGRGRPPKLRKCVVCGQMKRRIDFSNATQLNCRACGRNGASVNPVGVPPPSGDLSNMGQPERIFDLGARGPALLGHFSEMASTPAVTEQIKKLVPALPRCECCFESRHVRRDSYGGIAIVCARCEHQILATGTCHLHHGRTYYAELLKPAAVPSPPEVEALFAPSVGPRAPLSEFED